MTRAPIDTSRTVEIGRDWPKSLVLAVLCVGITALFVWSILGEPDGYHERRLRASAILILPLCGPFTFWVLFRLVFPVGAQIRIGPEGFTDRRVNPDPIPWDEITHVARRGEFVSLTISRRHLPAYSMSPSQRLLKRTRKTARTSHVLIANWCLPIRASELRDLIESYRHSQSGTQKST